MFWISVKGNYCALGRKWTICIDAIFVLIIKDINLIEIGRIKTVENWSSKKKLLRSNFFSVRNILTSQHQSSFNWTSSQIWRSKVGSAFSLFSWRKKISFSVETSFWLKTIRAVFFQLWLNYCNNMFVKILLNNVFFGVLFLRVANSSCVIIPSGSFFALGMLNP